ncbi:acyl-CoA N-acyltransferase [Mycena rebaudengoi]|nr:acyl-CoA N-acyltransferase [Mycena rebaudengoi]
MPAEIEITLFAHQCGTHRTHHPFADIHISCIERSDTIATFTPPLKQDKVIEFWRARVSEVQDGTRVIFMAFADAEEAGGWDGKRLTRYVILYRPRTETGYLRGGVEKLLVSPHFRRWGIERKLMEKLETDAKALGQTLLTLDTTTGSPAEIFYEKLGYSRLGVIPNYGVNPVDGSLIGETFYWKQL